MFRLPQILFVFLTLPIMLVNQAWPALAQVPVLPSGLAPGLYYYFVPGQSKPSVHYVPNPRDAYGDPFSKPVRPLPVAGQERFPTVSFDDLQNCSFAAMQAFVARNRPPAANSANRQPSPSAFGYQGQAPVNPNYQRPPQMAANVPSALGYQGQAPVNPNYQRPPQMVANVPSALGYQGQAPEETAAPGGSYGGAFSNQAQPAGTLSSRSPLKGITIEQMEEAAELTNKALKLTDNNRHAEAEQLLVQAAQFDPNPNSGVIHHNLGNVYEHLGRLPQAVREYQLSMQFDPKMATNLLSLGSCYQQMGRIPDAINTFQQFVQVEPRSTQANTARKLIASLSNAAKEQAFDNPNDRDYYNSVIAEGKFRWLPEQLPIKVFVATNGGGYRRDFKQYMCEAFDAWSQASGNRLTWALVNDRQAADIVCTWTSSAAGIHNADGAEGGQAAVTAYNGPNGQVVIKRADIVIVTRSLKGEVVSDNEVRKVCLHEVGHALGLQRHSSNNQDVMFFSETQTSQPQLTARDKATIFRLYADYPVLLQAAL